LEQELIDIATRLVLLLLVRATLFEKLKFRRFKSVSILHESTVKATFDTPLSYWRGYSGKEASILYESWEGMV